MKKEVIILWFKKDIRSQDHLPLYNAINENIKILPLFIYEPEVECHYDFSYRHWSFIHQSIKKLSIPIQEVYGSAHDVFHILDKNYHIRKVISHEETGNDLTYKRDLLIKSFLKKRKIVWKEYPTNAVMRGIKNRKAWDKNWIDTMLTPIKEIKKSVLFINTVFLDPLEEGFKYKLNEDLYLIPGEKEALKRINDFLENKVEYYFQNISYPEKSKYFSSLISPYITWGNITIRQIYQNCLKKKSTLKNKKSLDQFMVRLKWHCHFIQKLESAPEIEFKNMNKSFDNIRNKRNKKYIKAWKEGKTGYPLIDAAMRCVKETGHLNFRLRATVVSFLTHHLWQPWQSGSGYLAKMFIDYEPGIHFSQFQMQAATVGIHTLRIYNPVKQSKEKDKEAIFIKKWIPELKKLPLELIHSPWEITSMEESMYDFKYGIDYPKRIIDHEKGARIAKEKIWNIKNDKKTVMRSKEILKKHSRNYRAP